MCHPASIHTYPTADEHITDGLDCWCSPTYTIPCNECEDGAGCWKCAAGLITLSRSEAGECSVPLVIVHNR